MRKKKGSKYVKELFFPNRKNKKKDGKVKKTSSSIFEI